MDSNEELLEAEDDFVDEEEDLDDEVVEETPADYVDDESLIEFVKKNIKDEFSQETEVDQIKKAVFRENSRLREAARKPNIDDLVDAVVYLDDGTPVFVPDIGEKVVIERHSIILPDWGWLDTKTYVVRFINHETGHLNLWDLEGRQLASSNFIDGTKKGYKFKLPPKNGRLEPPVGRRQFRRSKFDIALQKELSEDSNEAPKRRGRPKGTKNRSKDEIKLEREKYRAEKAARAEKRDLQKLKAHAISQASGGTTTSSTPVRRVKHRKVRHSRR